MDGKNAGKKGEAGMTRARRGALAGGRIGRVDMEGRAVHVKEHRNALHID